jgi:hypothetical protein
MEILKIYPIKVNMLFSLRILVAALFCLLMCPKTTVAQVTYGAGYDVIIKNDGTIVTGKIVEVNLLTIKYQRLDMPEGPIMEIPRAVVYAITYRNQLTEYLQPVDSTVFYRPDEEMQAGALKGTSWYSQIDSGRLQVGLGLIRMYSKIKDVGSLKSEASSPALFIAYYFPFKRKLSLGVIAGISSFNYSENRISEYDQFQVTRNIKENIFTLTAAGMYRLGLGRLDPYFIGGISFYSSRANSEGTLRFLNDQRTVGIKNSASGTSLGVLVRGGVHYRFNPSTGAYFEVGNGLTLLQVGGTIKLDFK